MTNITMHRSYRYRLSVLNTLFIIASGWSTQTQSAPITFNTALPVAEDEYIAREQFVINQSGHDPSSANRDRTATAAVSVLGYGVNSTLAIFGILPYQHNSLKLTVGGKRLTRTASGFGDLTIFGRYTLFKQDWRGRNFRVAPIAGIKAPTGSDKKADSLGRLPASVQTGSGAWDPFAGVILTYQTLDYQLDSQLSYLVNNEANGFEAGDVARLDASFQYRLLPKTFTSTLPNFLYGVIEINLLNQQKNRLNGASDANSGGTRFFLTPGLQYVTKRWVAEAALQIPVSQNLNGTALENDYIARLSTRFNF